FRIIGPDGGVVVSVPAAVPTALGPDTCLNRGRAGGLHNAAWIAIESALERSFEEKASSYLVIASLANGDTIPLSLQDSGCRNGVTALAKQASLASPTLIPFPTSGRIGPTGTNALWALVAETHLLRSLDRGDTWAERPLPARPLVSPEITFIDDHEGWLDLIGPAGTQCTFQGVLLFHTVDAGAAWEQITPSGLDAQCKGGLTFVDRARLDRKSTRLNSSHEWISYAVFCLKKKKKKKTPCRHTDSSQTQHTALRHSTQQTPHA